MFCFQTEQNKRWCFNVLFFRQNKLEVVFQCFVFLDRTKLEVALQGFFFRQIKIRGGVSMFCFQTEQNKRWCFNVLFFRQDKIRGVVSRLFLDRSK